MSTVVTFNNRPVIEPGAYSQTKSLTSSVPQDFSSGNVLLIDTGSGAGYGGGSGSSGELASNLDSIYEFTNLAEAKAFLRGGILWDVIDYIFNPLNGTPGATKLMIARAATTTCASKTYTFTGGGANGGVVTFKARNEGVAGNGVISTKVRVGYGCQMKAGIVDIAKFMIEFFEGTYRGLDLDGDDYGGIASANSEPIMIARSVEFSNIADLITWMENDESFNSRFVITTGTVTGTGVVDAADLAGNNTLVALLGGTTTYSGTQLDNVLASIIELDNTFFFCDKYGADASGTENTKILAHITNDAEFSKFMVVGGGTDSTKFADGVANGSIEIAQYYNSEKVIVVHSGIKVPKLVGTGLKTLPALYHAAAVVGRLAGVAPQTSLTFKAIQPQIFNHQMKKSERETALQNGVLHNRFVPGIGFVVNQGINSIQKNTQMINPDGTSCEISIMRIAAQLNKELTLNIRPLFIGGNLNTSSPADVKAFIEGYLTNKVATKTQDNLIIGFEKVTVKQIQDRYEISYRFKPNSPINKIFTTGFIVDANLSA